MSFLGLGLGGGTTTTAELIEGCYSLSNIPGKQITKVLGLIEYTQKGLAGDMPGESAGVFQNLLKAAKERGANAVINIRLTSGTYQQQGSGWNVTYVIAVGDAVVLE